MVKIEAAEIPDVKIVTPHRFCDQRGFFCETYTRRAFSEIGIGEEFVQDNHVLSIAVGTVRGLHFQIEPFAQAKLVRVARGRILDVAVDLRQSSPSFGKHVAIELSEEDGRQLFVPVGFAHGYVTRTPECEVFYKVTQYYSPAHERALAFDDPGLGIDWGISPERAALSDKDRKNPRLSDVSELFD
jgi:dTDP-4-dehydrorhamnose 3,5-epimerase